MGSVIRMSVGKRWGSAFCIEQPEGLVFYTAAHVLKDIGFGSKSANGPAQLCDENMDSPSTFVVSVTSFDACCDLATFTCDFPAVPFLRCPRPQQGSEVAVTGYLFMWDGSMADCGIKTVLEGQADTFVEQGDCGRGFLRLRTVEPELHGMSGSPVSPSGDPAYAFGLLNGAPSENGGPPFTFTFI